MKLTPFQEKLVLLLLFLVLFALETVVAQRYLTSQVPGANDFYSRWHGAKALLLEGRDPYGLDVTAEIQPVIRIDPSEVGRGGFAYPLHVIFLFWPLVYLPYDWTQAIWLVMLQWLAIGTGIALIGWKRLTLKPAAALAVLLSVLFFYPVARTILLGQFTLHVAFFLVMALWLLDRGRDEWAGVFLAATSVKPQMVIFIGPWLVLWAMGQKRWRFVGGVVAGGAVMFAAAMLLFPRWPISFMEDVQRYSQVAGGRNPLALILETLWPGYPEPLRYLIAALLVAIMLYTWWQGWRATGYLSERALFWTIAVSLTITFQTGTTNQVLLVIPFFAWLLALKERRGIGVAAISLLAFELALWLLFFATISGNYENPLLFLPLPFFTLAILMLQAWKDYRLASTTP
jgi:hypothetical protein